MTELLRVGAMHATDCWVDDLIKGRGVCEQRSTRAVSMGKRWGVDFGLQQHTSAQISFHDTKSFEAPNRRRPWGLSVPVVAAKPEVKR